MVPHDYKMPENEKYSIAMVQFDGRVHPSPHEAIRDL